MDSVIMPCTDLFLALPMCVLALAIVSPLGRSFVNAILALSFVWQAQYARLMRGQIPVSKQELYVQAAQGTGTISQVILFRHILPNCSTPLLVKATLHLSIAILLLSSLSFIGLGAETPIAEWDAIIATGRKYFKGISSAACRISGEPDRKEEDYENETERQAFRQFNGLFKGGD